MTDAERLDRIVTASVIVAIIAVGIVVASFIPVPDGDSVDAGFGITTKPVDYPIDIPGCGEVQAPPEGDSSFVMTSTFGGVSTYDNPEFPWLSTTKAAAMSEAVRTALPSDVQIVLAPPSRSLTFGPVEDPDVTGVDPASNASAELTRDGTTSYVSIGVGPSSSGVPDCVAGALDSRETLSDGTIVDTLDTWYEIEGARTYSRSATAYHADGTRVRVYLSGGPSAELPLETEESATIAALPQLATSAAAPADTPPLRRDCSVYSAGEGAVQDIRPEALDRVNAALEKSWSTLADPPVLDRPIGSMLPAGFGSGACTDLAVVGSTTRLSVTVVGGQELPVAPDPYDSTVYGQLPVTRTAADGSVVQYYDADIMNMLTSEDGSELLSRSVTRTSPSGIQVSARSTVEVTANRPAPLTLPDPLPVEVLDAIANTQIGQWP